MKKIVFLLLFFCVISFSLNVPHYIGKRDVVVEFEDLLGFFDGIPIPNKVINGLDFEDGAHSLRLVGSYQEFLFKVVVDTIPPTDVQFTIREPNFVIFERPVWEVNYKSRLSFFGKKFEKTTKRYDKLPLVVCSKDEAENLGGFLYIPPSVENITPLDSKTPVSGILGKNILLNSQSPYKIVGKVLIPENSVLFFEGGVELKSIGIGEIVSKGTVYIPDNVKFTGNIKFSVEGNGTFYIEGRQFDGEISSNGGSLLFLKNVELQDINLSKTNVVIVKNSTLRNLKVSHVGLLVLENSTITELDIKNTRSVIVNNVNTVNVNVEGLTSIDVFSINAETFTISDFSHITMVYSNVKRLSLKRGTYFRGKKNTFYFLRLEMYSIANVFGTNVGKVELIKSRCYNRLSEFGEVNKDSFSLLEDY
ncbi:hypothetical protein SU69_01650 [Thermosipho melanesiensis]|uniref:Uncharacterized protein n=2 Tax=Thermosipho melanesiensis TaxID=46541 RepID=A6LJT5_THEM4|nr:hypothetical protein [Thermosipho melanesiensis]ABR30186.1 hypothetical protein Tmel_0314 [Thermosipho melanesiensis BI429]APT73385.1 hypothetical protein BW47_01705 [Thermosipho melanesiensis]OOC38198.1 hypothetical protein SU68_01655 [Thermosipho melanesiensis]OOC40119.1 hypothetical protein SU70_01650 [Thermosipho melanesiensis]OOC40171.1 hypothetical protein SU69_01650 [Thermosipho melanesiensis]